MQLGETSEGYPRTFLDGEIKSVRYLSDLRIRPEYRSSLLLARGFRILKREVFAQGEWAQTLVLDDNSDAAALLTSGRGGLPEYRPHGRYQTWFLRQQKVRATNPEIRVRTANAGDLEAMQRLHDQVGPSADYTPVLNFSAMPEVEFLLAFKGEELVGMLGIWDLSAHKSTVIEGYRRPMAFARQLYNLWASVRNLPLLPSAGASLDAQALTAVLCQERDPQILRLLLANALQRPGMFAIGLDIEDPLAQAFSGLRCHTTTAGHYLVGFSGEPPPASKRPSYFDFARL